MISQAATIQQHPDTGPSGDRARLKYTGYEAPGCGPCQSSANSRQSAALLNGCAEACGEQTG